MRWMKPEESIIYTINPDQQQYRLLQDLYNFLETEEVDSSFQILEPEEVIPIKELDGDTSKLVVFDDIKVDSRHMEPIKEYFSLYRNRNCNCIYLTQSYYNIPKCICRNTKAFCLFHGLDNKDIRQTADDHSNTISNEEFADIYRKASCELYSFMLLDKTSNHIPEMYRCGFDKFYLPERSCYITVTTVTLLCNPTIYYGICASEERARS